MKISRRRVLRLGGGTIAALSLPAAVSSARDVVEIAMGGRRNGSHVWFDPVGLRIAPGQIVRWVNHDRGNSHTATAYHPVNYDRPRRIPRNAEPWDSDYLLPGESFQVRLSVEGVYDYYCVPHEHAGMVGRIIVGEPVAETRPANDLPEAALRALPPVGAIMEEGIVRRL